MSLSLALLSIAHLRNVAVRIKI